MIKHWVGAGICATLFVAACGQTHKDEAVQYAPDPDCVTLPALISDRVDRSKSSADVTAGCRSFTTGGCEECCSSSRGLEGIERCLVLDASGEDLIDGACPATCEACAECNLEEENALRVFPGASDCDCSILRDTLGFDPAVPCERFCYGIEVAAWGCPHLVCTN